MDPEVQHVNDISQKLATFTIDTDTNSSIHTGSDQGDSTETESMIDRSVQLSQCICMYVHDERNIPLLIATQCAETI